MNLLYDLISMQYSPTGGSEYVFCVLTKLMDFLKKDNTSSTTVFGLFDSQRNIPAFLSDFINKNSIVIVDLAKENLSIFIKKNKISTLYIGSAQTYSDVDLSNLPCKIIATCHDINELTLLYDKNFTSKARKKLEPNPHPFIQSFKEFIKYFLHIFIEKKYITHIHKKYQKLEVLFQLKNMHIVTVSEYSKYAMLYYFNNIANPITVLSPPHKVVLANTEHGIENQALQELIDSKKKYFLLVSCTRFHKNAALFAEIWDKFCSATNYAYYGVLVGNIEVHKKNLIQLPYLSGYDLEQAFNNAFCLVYPTVAEGYGAPPMEAMKYGVPCICSNVTSLAEVYGDGSTVQFSPYYPEDLFRAMMYFLEHEEEYKTRALKKFAQLDEKQERDTETLVQMILNG